MCARVRACLCLCARVRVRDRRVRVRVRERVRVCACARGCLCLYVCTVLCCGVHARVLRCCYPAASPSVHPSVLLYLGILGCACCAVLRCAVLCCVVSCRACVLVLVFLLALALCASCIAAVVLWGWVVWLADESQSDVRAAFRAIEKAVVD